MIIICHVHIKYDNYQNSSLPNQSFQKYFAQDDIEGMFLGEDFGRLAENVDYFSLMTYDYSSPSRPGPNSPISWMEK